MSCERFETELTEHALGAPASPPLAAHLAACAACRSRVEDERSLAGWIDGELREAVRAEPSPAFLSRLRASMAEIPPPRRLEPAWFAATLAAGLGLLLLLWPAAAPPPEKASVVKVPPAPPAAAPDAPRPRRTAPPPSAAALLRRIDPLPQVALPVAAPAGVVVPPGQRDAILRLVSLMARGVVSPPSLLLEGPPAELSRPPELTVPELRLEPLATTLQSEPAGAEGA